MAFLNPNGTIVLVVANVDDSPKTVTVGIGDRQFELPVQAKSFNTMTWEE